MYRHSRVANIYINTAIDEERGSSEESRNQTAKRPHVHGQCVTFLGMESDFAVLDQDRAVSIMEFSYGASQSAVPQLDLSLLGFVFNLHAAPPKSVRIIRASTVGADISTFSGFRSLCTILVIDSHISVPCLI